MIYKVLTKTMFEDEFTRMGRGDQFSYEGLNALYDYLDETYCDGMHYELDVIALCCDWTEYELIGDALLYYGLSSIHDLKDNHYVLELDNGGVLVHQ